jgi:hypothetical protein
MTKYWNIAEAMSVQEFVYDSHKSKIDDVKLAYEMVLAMDPYTEKQSSFVTFVLPG